MDAEDSSTKAAKKLQVGRSKNKQTKPQQRNHKKVSKQNSAIQHSVWGPAVGFSIVHVVSVPGIAAPAQPITALL